jgi:hypothetical protein
MAYSTTKSRRSEKGEIMTLDEASKIVRIWGVYLEYCQGRLMSLFHAQIPESLLPFPKDTIEEATNIVAEYHHNMGNQDQVKALQTAMAVLLFYEDDEKALLQAANSFNDQKFRQVIIGSLKKSRKDWIEALGRTRVNPLLDSKE